MIGTYKECRCGFPCSDPNSLAQIRGHYSSRKIKTTPESQLVRNLITQGVLSPDVMDNNFLPYGPGDSTEWFSGGNINEHMKLPTGIMGGCHGKTLFDEIEVEEGTYMCSTSGALYKREITPRRFHGFGYHMRDFSEYETELTKYDFDNSEYNCYGIVFNTDRTGGYGEHWVSVFINYIEEPYTIEYFDSSGESIMKDIIPFFKKLKGNIVWVSNRLQQKDAYSCGAYALYYIYARKEGVPMQYFRDWNIGDDLMHKFRENLFRKIE